MKVFISHDFEDRPEFDNLVAGLANAGVPYWDPNDVRAGRSLRDQLREAIAQCSVCVFIATRKSVESSWCGAELGAFWGAGKSIIVYIAERSLAEDELPPIVRGDVWDRRIANVARSAKELVSQAQPGTATTASVSNMTAEQLAQLIQGAVSLAMAVKKDEGGVATVEALGEAAAGAAGRVLEAVRTTDRLSDDDGGEWRRDILWVDDRPDNNRYERMALEAVGLRFTLAQSTREALDLLAKRRFAAIISDMGRREGPNEGYALLEALRKTDPSTPYFIYAGSRALAHRREAAARGAQGTTNNAPELFDMVLQALHERPNAPA